MSEINDRIAALESALSKGVRRVLFREGGTHREVEYFSLSEMRKELNKLKRERVGSSGRTYAAFRSGV
jgi:hypothetical protein